MGDVIDFGAVQVGLRTRRKKGFCTHDRLEYDPSCESVSCADCGEPIGAFRAFMTLVRNHERAWDDIKRRQAEVNDARERSLHLIAAREVESAWRSRKFIPTCPHCGDPIFPDDGFGRSCMGRKVAEKRREEIRAAKAERARFIASKPHQNA